MLFLCYSCLNYNKNYIKYQGRFITNESYFYDSLEKKTVIKHLDMQNCINQYKKNHYIEKSKISTMSDDDFHWADRDSSAIMNRFDSLNTFKEKVKIWWVKNWYYTLLDTTKNYISIILYRTGESSRFFQIYNISYDFKIIDSLVILSLGKVNTYPKFYKKIDSWGVNVDQHVFFEDNKIRLIDQYYYYVRDFKTNSFTYDLGKRSEKVYQMWSTGEIKLIYRKDEEKDYIK